MRSVGSNIVTRKVVAHLFLFKNRYLFTRITLGAYTLYFNVTVFYCIVIFLVWRFSATVKRRRVRRTVSIRLNSDKCPVSDYHRIRDNVTLVLGKRGVGTSNVVEHFKCRV